MQFSTINIPVVHHIGLLDNRRKPDIYGSGLSVSTCHDDWERIAHLQDYPLWQLNKPNGVFADYLSADKDSIIRYGVSNGLLAVASALEMPVFDDEGEVFATELFLTESEFLREYDEIELMRAKRVICYQATSKMLDIVELDHAINPFELVFQLYITEHHKNIDGIWFSYPNDKKYSAPFGIINDSSFQARWNKTLIN